MNILVTVGMSAWPFDRLLQAIIPLCSEHQVFVQTGTSKVALPCSQSPFIPYEELIKRIQTADLVITHAGNTVRLVQRANKIPIAKARMAPTEMANNHQVEYLRHEEQVGRVIAVWDLNLLPQVVTEHTAIEAKLLSERDLNQPAEAAQVITKLDQLWHKLTYNPFKAHPLRRYAYAWDELSTRSGQHLDIGCGTGEFLSILAATTQLNCQGVDPHHGYLQQVKQAYPDLVVSYVHIKGPLPFPDKSFNSVSMLDVLEHCPNEDNILHEVQRVLQPDGLLVLTVPAQHFFSWLDPDNAKYRLPWLHQVVYSLRFGPNIYRERFVDQSNGLCGDMSIGKQEHTNYKRDWLVDRLRNHGFEITRESGANLFWRWFQIPALLGGPCLRRSLEHLIWLDGELFKSANLFISARKVS